MTSIHRSAANGIGVIVLAALAGLVACFIAALYTRADAIWAWSIGFPVLAICALLLWHDKRWPADPQDALQYGLLSIPAGGISLMVDFLVGSSMGPQLPFRYAIWQAGSPFGIILTICICPGFTIVALAGAARGFLLKSKIDSAA